MSMVDRTPSCPHCHNSSGIEEVEENLYREGLVCRACGKPVFLMREEVFPENGDVSYFAYYLEAPARRPGPAAR